MGLGKFCSGGCKRKHNGIAHRRPNFVPRGSGPGPAKKHGMHNTPEYRTWEQLRGRCFNKNSPRYPEWGGRGITVCSEWNDFARFYADMGPKPSANHSIDRIDVNGPYAPWNCRWATRSEQQRNRRDNVWLTYQGKTMLLGDWAQETGIHRNTLQGRLKRGWPTERILTTPTSSRTHQLRLPGS